MKTSIYLIKQISKTDWEKLIEEGMEKEQFEHYAITQTLYAEPTEEAAREDIKLLERIELTRDDFKYYIQEKTLF